MSRIVVVMCVVAIAIGLWTRWQYLDAQGLWHDEFYTFSLLRGVDPYLFPGSDLLPVEALRPAGVLQSELAGDQFWSHLRRDMLHEGHPPLYYMCARLWTSALGFSPHTLRALSAVASMLMIGVFALTLYVLDGPFTALAGAALAAASPFAVYFAQECRHYALGLLCLSACALAVALIVRRRAINRSSGYSFALMASCAVLTHYYLLIDVVILAALVAVCARHTAPIRRIALCAVPLLVFTLWSPILSLQARTHQGSHWTEGILSVPDIARGAGMTISELTLGPHVVSSGLISLGLTIIALMIAAVLARANDAAVRQLVAVLSSLIVLHLAAVCAIDYLTAHHTIAVARYSFGVLLPLLAIAALAMTHTGTWGRAILPACLVALTATSIATAAGIKAPRQMLREAAAYIDAHASQSDQVVVVPSGPTLVGLAYYLSPNLLVAAVPPSALQGTIEATSRRHGTAWIAVQRLGVSSHEVAMTPETAAALGNPEIVHFAGLDLLRVTPHDERH
jgi:uncharacterized membrane protein